MLLNKGQVSIPFRNYSYTTDNLIKLRRVFYFLASFILVLPASRKKNLVLFCFSRHHPRTTKKPHTCNEKHTVFFIVHKPFILQFSLFDLEMALLTKMEINLFWFLMKNSNV